MGNAVAIKKRILGKRAKQHISNIIVYIILAVMSFIWLIPIFWLILSSFRGEGFAFVEYFFPKTYTFDNYLKLFSPENTFLYSRWFLNTFIVAIFTCIISTMFVLMVSFALSRIRFKLRRPIMNVVLILGMFPGFMTMIAIYYILEIFKINQTLFALVIVYSMGAGMGYYISKGFFDTIPKTLDEAARLDGCTKNGIFWRIILPLSKPIIVYTVLMAFIAPWVDFMMVRVIMRDNFENYTVALGLWKMLTREYKNEYFTQFCAGAVIVAIPIIILFNVMQKYYVEGVTGGAVKG